MVKLDNMTVSFGVIRYSSTPMIFIISKPVWCRCNWSLECYIPFLSSIFPLSKGSSSFTAQVVFDNDLVACQSKRWNEWNDPPLLGLAFKIRVLRKSTGRTPFCLCSFTVASLFSFVFFFISGFLVFYFSRFSLASYIRPPSSRWSRKNKGSYQNPDAFNVAAVVRFSSRKRESMKWSHLNHHNAFLCCSFTRSVVTVDFIINLIER